MILPMASAGGAPGLGLKLRGSTEVTPIPGTEGVRDVVYAPDGEWIAYALGSDIYKRPLIGGSAVQLAEDASANARVGLAWLDDGTILYDVGPELFQISQDGGVPLGVVTLPSAVWVHGLPGASGALVVTADNELHVVDLGDQSSEVVLEEVRRAWYAPTGHVVYVRTDGAVFAQPFDLGSLAVTGGAVPLFDGVRLGPFIADMRLGADGTVLYVEGTTTTVAPSQLIVVDLEGNAEALALAPRPFGDGSVGWSPDGASIAFRSGWQIYTYNTVLNTTPRQLTFERINFDPTFSPDGMRVAFTSVGDGTNGWDLFVKDLNDDTPPRPIITLDGNQRMIGWPADTLILFENQSGNSSDLWIVDISVPDDPETRAYLTSEADLTGITVSPDGTLAAYGSNEAGTLGIYVRSFPTPGERTIVYSGAASGLTWSPDGGTLYAFTEGRDQHAIAIRLRRDPVPIVLGVDTLFTRPPGGVEPPPGSVLHPDGDRFILTRAPDVPTSGADETQPDRLILVTNFFEELRQRTDGN